MRGSWRGAGVSLLAVAVLALTAACSTGDEGGGNASAARGGSLVIARAEENKTLDPAVATSPADIAPINEIFGQHGAPGRGVGTAT